MIIGRMAASVYLAKRDEERVSNRLKERWVLESEDLEYLQYIYQESIIWWVSCVYEFVCDG